MSFEMLKRRFVYNREPPREAAYQLENRSEKGVVREVMSKMMYTEKSTDQRKEQSNDIKKNKVFRKSLEYDLER
ncbi:hypothetical protein [Bacillus sp. FSL M8-0168]|uniref:hypothetical protein n=1 Tax=Bacillus sp. FSL M8-0168 TaxID=2921614 RepID=UPI0030FD63D6